MKEERFLLSKKTVWTYFLLAIPLSLIFLVIDQNIIFKIALIITFFGFIYAVVHKYVFKNIFKGGPNISSKPEDIKLITELPILKEGLKIIEIGSGNGHISIALAKKGLNVTGIDINPSAVLIARINAISNRVTTCRFKVANMWTYEYKDFDIAVVYCIDHAMGELKSKLFSEMKSGSYIISNYFKFPGLKEDFSSKNIYVYKVP